MLDLYSSLDVHTTDTIKAGRAELDRYAGCLTVCLTILFIIFVITHSLV